MVREKLRREELSIILYFQMLSQDVSSILAGLFVVATQEKKTAWLVDNLRWNG